MQPMVFTIVLQNSIDHSHNLFELRSFLLDSQSNAMNQDDATPSHRCFCLEPIFPQTAIPSSPAAHVLNIPFLLPWSVPHLIFVLRTHTHIQQAASPWTSSCRIRIILYRTFLSAFGIFRKYSSPSPTCPLAPSSDRGCGRRWHFGFVTSGTTARPSYFLCTLIYLLICLSNCSLVFFSFKAPTSNGIAP